MWRLCVSILFLELQIAEGTENVQITPCTDSSVEVPLGESLTLTCTPRTQSMEWRFNTKSGSYLLAKLENSQFKTNNTFYNFFAASIDQEGISLTINTRNNRNMTQLNGTVLCTDLTQSEVRSSNCELNYVYKPVANNISCQAKADPTGDQLNCTIYNFYSSRGIYTCQAFRENDKDSEVEVLNTVNMATSNVGKGLNVSGECHITTKPPQTSGNYSYLVKISPGGSDILAKLPNGTKWIEYYSSSQAAIYNVPTVWLIAALILL